MANITRHIPVLAHEIAQYVPTHAQLILDGTLGHGGHVQFLSERLGSQVRFVGFDVDGIVIEKAKNYLQDYENVEYVHASYASIPERLDEHDLWSDFILLDLGINWEHILQAERGFSIKKDGPLDMRFGDTQHSAYDIIQRSHGEQIIDRLIRYGDFRPKRAEDIAYCISKHKRSALMKTTLGLRKLLKNIKVADKELAVVFQVLRIVTNNELDHVEHFLEQMAGSLAPGGRCAIISYHSVEDRIVKNGFKKLTEDPNYQLLTKHVIKPSHGEISRNKAARSAKLRIIEYTGE